MKYSWPLVKLEEVADLTVGFVGTMAKHYTPNGITFLRSTNVGPFDITLDDIKYISPEFNEKLSKSQLRTGDVVIVRTGKPGACAVIPEIKGSWNCSDLVIVRPHVEKLDPVFLAAYINFASGTINSQLVGAVQQHFNVASAKKLEIPLPNINVQKRISSLIDSLNDKITLNNKINDNLKQQALALYRSLFVDFERVSSNDRISSELGDIPLGWNIKTLAEVTTNIRTRVHNHSYKVLSALNSGCLQPSEEYFTKQVFSKDISNYIVVKENEFAYNPARVNIGSIGLNTLGYIGCVSPVYVVFRAESEYHYFMDFFIKSARFKEEVRIRSSGSVRQTMNYADFGLIKIAYPPLSAIRQFNEEYEIITKCINHNLEENAVLERIRDSLIPKLMSGEIDVSDIQV